MKCLPSVAMAMAMAVSRLFGGQRIPVERSDLTMRHSICAVSAVEHTPHTPSVTASLHVPDPAPINDAYMAATALVHNLTMVTRNLADFTRSSGLEVANPWGA